jgi:DNA-binding NtrC family response regulator
MTTILLVDDDSLQASLMLSLLGRRFGEVCRATDAAEALCLIEQPEFARKLGLVICGHQTRGIGGPAFAAEVHLRLPWLPVLVLGRAGEAASDYACEFVRFLPWPVASAEMLALAGEMIESGQAKKS